MLLIQINATYGYQLFFAKTAKAVHHAACFDKISKNLKYILFGFIFKAVFFRFVLG